MQENLLKKRMQGNIEKNQKKVVAGEQEFKTMKVNREHYSWRDSFDLDEQALNMAQRRAARGSSYKAPTPKPQPKPAPQVKPVAQAKPAAPAPQAKPAAPHPKNGKN